MEGNAMLFWLVMFPILGGLAVYLTGRRSKKVRDVAANLVTISEFAVLAYLLITKAYNGDNSCTVPGICGLGLHFRYDGFRAVYCGVAGLMWMMTTLFSPEYFRHYHNRNRYYLFTMFTLGATMGVFLSADLFTTFIFFEIMSFTSYVWVAQDERAESLRAAETYLAVAVIGGMVMLMGLFLLYNMTGTLVIAELQNAVEDYLAKGSMRNVYVACGCVFFGFAAKAGAFPLHIWLPKAHPVAPAPASALLSGILTKAGVFGILVVSFRTLLGDVPWGRFLLVIGLITMVLGAVLALFSVDLKRTLACSSMSQIGFILIGVAMGCMLGEEEGALAARGALLHMVNHSLIKLVLFMAAGVVYMNLHKLNLNGIRGFGRRKPFLHVVFLLGAMGISGIPLMNGYVSKTLLHEAILEGGRFLGNPDLVEWIFLVSGGLTLAYMTKLYVCIFIEKNEDPELQNKYDNMKDYIGLPSRLALGISGLILPVLGVAPNLVNDRIADIGQEFLAVGQMEHAVHYFSAENLKGGAISIAVGALVYLLIVRKLLMRNHRYVDAWPRVLDLENAVYRPVLLRILPGICGLVCRILDSIIDGGVVLSRKTVYHDRKLPHELEEGDYGTHVMGSMMDGMNGLLNKTIRRSHPKHLTQSYEHRLAMHQVRRKEIRVIVTRSLSFGLAFTCLGLLLTIGYMLYYLLF